MPRSPRPKSPKIPRRASAPRKSGSGKVPRKGYHHGDLRRVLIESGLELVDEGGLTALNVRETARRSGVSAGAPFRHFPTRQDLIAAVAAEAQTRFAAEIAAAIAGAPADDPLARFRAIGIAYLRWAIRNPRHFEVISDQRLFSHEAPSETAADNANIIAMTERTLAEALARGQLRVRDLKTAQIAGRALVYGYARMFIDGHFPRWNVSAAEAGTVAEAIVDLFIDGIAAKQTSP